MEIGCGRRQQSAHPITCAPAAAPGGQRSAATSARLAASARGSQRGDAPRGVARHARPAPGAQAGSALRGPAADGVGCGKRAPVRDGGALRQQRRGCRRRRGRRAVGERAQGWGAVQPGRAAAAQVEPHTLPPSLRRTHHLMRRPPVLPPLAGQERQPAQLVAGSGSIVAWCRRWRRRRRRGGGGRWAVAAAVRLQPASRASGSGGCTAPSRGAQRSGRGAQPCSLKRENVSRGCRASERPEEVAVGARSCESKAEQRGALGCRPVSRPLTASPLL